MDRKHKGHKRELLPAVVYFGYDRGIGVITCCLTRTTNFHNLLFKVVAHVFDRASYGLAISSTIFLCTIFNRYLKLDLYDKNNQQIYSR